MVTTKKNITMSINGRASSFLPDKLLTFIMSIATAGIVGCFAFLWKLNSALAKLEDHDTENIEAREEWSMKANTMQLDIRDIRERVIRIEARNQKQYP